MILTGSVLRGSNVAEEIRIQRPWLQKGEEVRAQRVFLEEVVEMTAGSVCPTSPGVGTGMQASLRRLLLRTRR